IQFLFLYDKIVRLHKENGNIFNWNSLSTATLNLPINNPIKLEKKAKSFMLGSGILQMEEGTDSVSKLTEKGINYPGFLIEAVSEKGTEYPRVLRAYSNPSSDYYYHPAHEEIVYDKLDELHFMRKFDVFIIKTFYEPKNGELDTDEKIIDNCFTYLFKNQHHAFKIEHILAFIGVTAFNSKAQYYGLKLLKSGLVLNKPGYGDESYRIKLNEDGIIALTEHIKYSDYLKAKKAVSKEFTAQQINYTSHGDNSPIAVGDINIRDIVKKGPRIKLTNSSESKISKKTLAWAIVTAILTLLGIVAAILISHNKL
ncbi:MAG TPA: hypothetical protein VNX68_11250, partial [Nitrosopumilaceae archaeon]|nr:hypothetical protein [Nitrosopumilaceae archaeon]